ncbi:RNA polymerase sigma factor [Rhodohalobacter sulfatireducens]|uniref:RNA polymerase sigma factor n=1 Tax=Rhodohalobacter sulfatireducens TaxID=2911366 RepID=A0ABS9KDN4_9BACT|nr:RNA polymerase sigma factor [Rhodohalobacter sulfatireducens]MCG2588951.1 RNA polymerase sigma factor [Rhodohalobacter sulfatireducens]
MAETTDQKTLNFDELYEEYGDRILNMVYRMTGEEEAARDLTQDIFMKVYENLEDFKYQSSAYTWIYRIATNHTLNYLKKRNRYKWLDLLERSVSEVIQSETPIFEFWGNDGFESPDMKLEKEEREVLVWKLIQKLPVKYRLPLVLQRYDEMGNKEIADVMDLSISAVDSRIYRAKKKLLDLMKPHLEDLRG